MGKLIDPQKRQRAQQQRAAKKRRILDEARTSFETLPYVEVTLDSIGQRAKVDRGVASMFFQSKEGLFLLVLKEELDGWYRDLEETFVAIDEALTGEQIACLLTDSLTKRPAVTRLLSLAPVVFEHNLDAMDVFRIQRWRRDRMDAIGREIDRTLGRGIAGGGVHVLQLAHLIAAGLDPSAYPRGAAAYDHGDPDFAVFSVDMESEMKHLLTAVLAADSC
jgi:AcrR family transcriptional regulator